MQTSCVLSMCDSVCVCVGSFFLFTLYRETSEIQCALLHLLIIAYIDIMNRLSNIAKSLRQSTKTPHVCAYITWMIWDNEWYNIIVSKRIHSINTNDKRIKPLYKLSMWPTYRHTIPFTTTINSVYRNCNQIIRNTQQFA